MWSCLCVRVRVVYVRCACVPGVCCVCGVSGLSVVVPCAQAWKISEGAIDLRKQLASGAFGTVCT